MEIVLYHAMTAAEFQKFGSACTHIGWMACHYSPYGTGLANLPPQLPEGSLLIFNDRTPISGHDPDLIAQQLQQQVSALKCCGVLLDFQRPGSQAVASAIAKLSCPVAITPSYAKDLDCGVFLPSPPLTCPLEKHIAPWQSREIWLEAATDRCCIRVTADGSSEVERPPIPCPQIDTLLHCRYGIDIGNNWAQFHLHRDRTQLQALMEEGRQLGISRFVGLYQQLGLLSSQAEAQETARFQL